MARQIGCGDNRAARQAAALAAGSAALGRTLSGPEPIRDSDWTVVLRCADQAGPAGGRGTVIVKAYPPGPDGESSFAAEAAGLAQAGHTGLAPELLAADQRSLTVVMSDLGRAPSLADTLLGATRDRAAQALLDWAEACGRLSVATAGREPEFARLRRTYAGGSDMKAPGPGLEQRVLSVADRAALVGVTTTEELAAELAEVAAEIATPACPVFSPGDICPDNNLLTPAVSGSSTSRHPATTRSSWTPPTCGCRSAPAGACSGCHPGCAPPPRRDTGLRSRGSGQSSPTTVPGSGAYGAPSRPGVLARCGGCSAGR